MAAIITIIVRIIYFALIAGRVLQFFKYMQGPPPSSRKGVANFADKLSGTRAQFYGAINTGTTVAGWFFGPEFCQIVSKFCFDFVLPPTSFLNVSCMLVGWAVGNLFLRLAEIQRRKVKDYSAPSEPPASLQGN